LSRLPELPDWNFEQPGTHGEAEPASGAEGYVMEGPHLEILITGAVVPLRPDVTTIGRGRYTDIRLADPSVSILHAEIVRRGVYVYVSDLGLSRNGTRVNGRLVARRLLCDGDALTFGSARCRIGGIMADEAIDAEPPKSAEPELTRRELDVIASLCRSSMSDDAFVTPATAKEIAADLVVTEAAVKQHLLRLYSKLRIPEGQNRRTRLANEVIALGLAKPQMPEEQRTGQIAPWAQAASPTTSAAPAGGSPTLARPPPTVHADRRTVTGRSGGPA
jgi:DNA-binding CsgD family transcriptional regulator